MRGRNNQETPLRPREDGVAMCAALLLWLTAMVLLAKRAPRRPETACIRALILQEAMDATRACT